MNFCQICSLRSHAPVDGADQEAEVDHENPVKNGVVPLTDSEVCPDKILADLLAGVIPEKDVPRHQKVKGSGEEESMKPTRISERLIIKRNRQGETEDDCSGPSQTQTPPRKGKTVSSTGLFM